MTQIQWVRYDTIAALADSFLEQYHPSGIIPVPIEPIVESRLGLEIIPMPRLQRDFGVEGFTGNLGTAIYVDEGVFSNVEVRYRFTLAHEVGHLQLHRPYLEQFQIRSQDDWLQYQAGVAPEDFQRLEWQACCFGGLVLVPDRHLSPRFQQQAKNISPLCVQAVAKGLPQDQVTEYALSVVAEEICSDFAVSAEVVLRRLKLGGYGRLLL